MNTRKKMNSGGYNHKLAYPRVPVGMSRRQALTDPEFIPAMTAWDNEEVELIRQFRADLEEEFGTQNWDRRQQAWDLAWDEGHSGGFSEVFNHYINYVEAFFK